MRKITAYILIIVFVLFTLSGCGETAEIEESPSPEPSPSEIPVTASPVSTPLHETAALQRELRAYMKDNLSGRWAVCVEDLVTGENFVLYRDFEEDECFPAASTIKLFVLCSVYDKASKGEFEIGDEYNRMLAEKMITISSNNCANILTKAVGGTGAVTGYIRKGLGFELSSMNKLIGSQYDGKDNLINPTEAMKLLELLYYGEVVDRRSSEEMLGFMLKQEINNKVSLGIGEDGQFAHKTGEYFELANHDMGIVYMKGHHDYSICCFSGESKIDEALNNMKEISEIVYNYFETT